MSPIYTSSCVKLTTNSSNDEEEVKALARFKFVKLKKTYGKCSANKTLPGVSKTWRQVMAMHNPTKMFIYQLIFKYDSFISERNFAM